MYNNPINVLIEEEFPSIEEECPLIEEEFPLLEEEHEDTDNIGWASSVITPESGSSNNGTHCHCHIHIHVNLFYKSKESTSVGN